MFALCVVERVVIIRPACPCVVVQCVLFGLAVGQVLHGWQCVCVFVCLHACLYCVVCVAARARVLRLVAGVGVRVRGHWHLWICMGVRGCTFACARALAPPRSYPN